MNIYVKLAQLRPTLCDPTDYTVHRILQARILKWVAIPFSKGSSQLRNRTQVYLDAGKFTCGQVMAFLVLTVERDTGGEGPSAEKLIISGVLGQHDKE